MFADGGDDGCTEGDVGNEVAVHDINVKPVSVVCCDGTSAFCPESREVGGKD